NIEQDLKKKGIKEDFILIALDEYPYEQQLEDAIHLASKKWEKARKNSEIESIQKVKACLLNKRYSYDVVDEAMAAIDTERDRNAEYNDEVKQADKARKG